MPRKISRVRYSTKFLKRLLQLPKRVAEKAKRRENIFRNNPFDSRLRTHKLHGKDQNSWAFWIDYNYRIKFIFLNEEEVLFLDVGAHRIYR